MPAPIEQPESFPLFIGGQPVTTENELAVRLPFDSTLVGVTYTAGEREVAAALEAASAATREMRRLSAAERSALLLKAWQLLGQQQAEMTRVVMNETGKPIREARVELGRALETLQLSAEEARRLHGEVVPIEGVAAGKGRMAMTIREPLGVIAAITPFNVPLNLALHKVAPALAAGNTVVHKPASATPLSASRLAAIFHQAGFPAGAYNVVAGPGGVVGDRLVDDPRVRMVSFTGSVEVGARIHGRAGVKRVTLELGGNAGVIVEPDGYDDALVPRCITAAFAHSGQVCISLQRAYVHESLYDRFLDEFTQAAARLKIGHPAAEDTDISSLITEGEARRVEQWIAEARAAGARVVLGGQRTGATVAPTILTDVPPSVSVSCREVFGPVVAVYRYRHLDEAIERVNDSVYGLQAGIYTRDLAKAFRAARQLEVGGVMINDVPMFRADIMPYGGVKLSGMGREGPRYAIEEMTEPKLICWKT
jgi:acyl-CoA reductase-like NAD-dependent aldehyde dehydrogenase